MITTNVADLAKYTLGNSAQTIAQDRNYELEVLTPDNKDHEGIDSAGRYRPYPGLPLLRYEPRYKMYTVISSQKPVAHMSDEKGNHWLVPAGLGLDLKAVKDAGGETAADSTAKIKYTALDVRMGVKNYKGDLVTDGEPVVKSMFDGATQKAFISPFCGIVNYNVMENSGGDGTNPAQLNRRNFNPQAGVSYNMDYSYRYPMVKDDDTYAKAPLVGIAAFVGEKAMPGQFITYDINSNFVLADKDGFTYGTTEPQFIIGQVQRLTVFRDPNDNTKIINEFNHLNQVLNGTVYNNSPLAQLPGVNNTGLTSDLQYSGGYGQIHFSLQTR